MRFKVEGVHTETGKKVPPQEIVADDQREAATMAKLLNVSPTKITPITDLVTVEISEPTGDKLVEPRRTTLISVDGHPKWFVATLILALLIASVWIFGGSRDSDTLTAVPTNILEPGLGWSLEEIKQQWPISDGWYWSESELATRVGEFQYIANNISYPKTLIIVTGTPKDLYKFEIDVPIAVTDSDMDPELHVEVVCLKVNWLMDAPEGLLQWMADQMRIWAKHPQASYRKSKVFGTRSIEFFVIVDAEYVSMLLTITATD